MLDEIETVHVETVYAWQECDANKQVEMSSKSWIKINRKFGSCSRHAKERSDRWECGMRLRSEWHPWKLEREFGRNRQGSGVRDHPWRWCTGVYSEGSIVKQEAQLLGCTAQRSAVAACQAWGLVRLRWDRWLSSMSRRGSAWVR
jgi:hypothetical protein